MRTAIILTFTGLALAAAPAPAFAACTISDAAAEQKLSKIEGIGSGDYGAVRRDVRELRSAAMVLQRYGRDEACQQLVTAMNELLRDPKAALDTRNKPAVPAADSAAADAAKTDQPAAATDGKANPDTTASTELPAVDAAPMTMDQRREAAVPFTERKAVMSAAELIGADVYGSDNQSIGEIDDIVVAPDNKPAYALISYGGFLGMGEEQAAVPVSAIRMSADNYIFVQLNADQLKAAPKLKRGTADWWTNETFRTENDAYYTQVN